MTKVRAKIGPSVYAVPPHSGSLERNVRVEPIDNGFIRSETNYGPDGSYSHTKKFHKTHPGLDAEKAPVGPSPLRVAIDHVKGPKR